MSMVRRGTRALWLSGTALAWLVSSACVASTVRTASVTDRLVRQGTPSVTYGDEHAPFIEEQFRKYTRQVRTAHLDATPQPKMASSASVETTSIVLKQLLAELEHAPTGPQHRAVAQEYRRLGILDLAYTHLSRAIELNPKDAVAYDLRARLWRQWDLPHMGVGDANRAVFYAPKSAAAWNTLGTLLHLSGQLEPAAKIYAKALSVDRWARYVWSNVCLLRRDQGRADLAAEACARAREISTRGNPADAAMFAPRAIARVNTPESHEGSWITATRVERLAPADAAGLVRDLSNDLTHRPIVHAVPANGQALTEASVGASVPAGAAARGATPTMSGLETNPSHGQLAAEILRRHQTSAPRLVRSRVSHGH